VSQNSHFIEHPGERSGASRAQPSGTVPPVGTACREIELKLHVAPSDLARLARHPALVGLQQGTATSSGFIPSTSIRQT
jgi:triphosphatase